MIGAGSEKVKAQVTKQFCGGWAGTPQDAACAQKVSGWFDEQSAGLVGGQSEYFDTGAVNVSASAFGMCQFNEGGNTTTKAGRKKQLACMKAKADDLDAANPKDNVYYYRFMDELPMGTTLAEMLPRLRAFAQSILSGTTGDGSPSSDKLDPEKNHQRSETGGEGHDRQQKVRTP